MSGIINQFGVFFLLNIVLVRRVLLNSPFEQLNLVQQEFLFTGQHILPLQLLLVNHRYDIILNTKWVRHRHLIYTIRVFLFLYIIRVLVFLYMIRVLLPL